MTAFTTAKVNVVVTSEGLSAEFFQLFIKQCNVFNHILSHGKIFVFLQMLEEPSLRPATLQVPVITNGLKSKEVSQAIGRHLKFFILTERKPRNGNI